MRLQMEKVNLEIYDNLRKYYEYENNRLREENKNLKSFVSVTVIARTIVESTKLMLRTEGQDQSELKKYLHHLIAQYNEVANGK